MNTSIMNRLALLLITLLHLQIINGQSNFNLDLVPSPECAGSENGSIMVSISLNNTIPLNLPYPLPYEVSYEHEDGTTGVNIMTTNPYSINFLKAGKYKITLYFNDECYAEGQTEILEIPNTMAADYEVNGLKCKNDAMIIMNHVIGGSSPYQFNWSNGSTNHSLFNLDKTGSYTLTITDANECKLKREFLIEKEIYFCNSSMKPSITKYINETQKGAISFSGPNDNPELKFYWKGPSGFTSNKKVLSNLEVGTYCLDVFCCGIKIYDQLCYNITKDCDVIKEPTGIQTIELCKASNEGIKLIIDNYKESKFEIYGGGAFIDKSNLVVKFGSVGTFKITVIDKNTFCSEVLEVNVIDTRSPIEVEVNIIQNPTCEIPYKTNGLITINNKSNKNITYELKTYFTKKIIDSRSLAPFTNSGVISCGVDFYKLYYTELNKNCGYGKDFALIDPNPRMINLHVTNENVNCNGKLGKVIVELLNKDDELYLSWDGLNNGVRHFLKKGVHTFNLPIGKYTVVSTCNEIGEASIIQEFFNYPLKIEVTSNDYYTTPEGEGEIKVSGITSICVDRNADAYYYITKDKISDCIEVQNKGLKLANGIDNFSITGLTEGTYYLYYSCGGCCSQNVIEIPHEDSPLELDLNCGSNNGYRKLVLRGFENCKILNWIRPINGEPRIENTQSRSLTVYSLAKPGFYCVNLECQSNSKKICRYVDIIPKVNIEEKCSNNKKDIQLVELSDGPFTYQWWDGDTKSFKTLPNNGHFSTVIVKDNNLCENLLIIPNNCCPTKFNSGSDCKLIKQVNPTLGLNNGSIRMSTSCKYKWTGPNGFKYDGDDGSVLDNLANGDYVCETSDCKKITVKLRDCSQNNYKLTYSGNQYCGANEIIRIKFVVSGDGDLTPPYTLDSPNFEILHASSDHNKGIFEFDYNASQITKGDNPRARLIDGAGCISWHPFNSENILTAVLNISPPNCKIEYWCRGKKTNLPPTYLYYTEDYISTDCILVQKCEGNTNTIYGNKKKMIIHNQDADECIEGSICEFILPNNKKEIRSAGDWKKVACPPIDWTGGTRDNDPDGFQTNYNDLYKKFLSFWPNYGNKLCGSYRWFGTTNYGYDTYWSTKAYKDVITYCFDNKTQECKETHDCWRFPDGKNDKEVYDYTLHKDKEVAAANCKPGTPNCPSEPPPGLKDCPTTFHYLNNLNVFVSLGFNGKAIKMNFYDQNGVFINERHTQVSIPEGQAWEFSIINLIPQGTGFSILANASKVTGIGSTIIPSNDNPSVIKIDYDGNGVFVNSSLLFTDPYTKLYDVLINPNGSADLLVTHDANDINIGGQGSGLKIINLNNNNLGNSLYLPMNSGPSQGKLIKSNGGLTIISTNNTSIIPSVEISTYSMLTSSWTTNSIPVNGTINSINSAQLGNNKVIVNYTSLDGTIHSASTLDVQNPSNGFINTLTSTQFMEAKSIIPDLQTGDYYVTGTFKGDMEISPNNSISSFLNNLFLIRYNSQNNVMSYVTSTGSGSNNLIDGIVSTDNKFGLLARYNGADINFNGVSADGVNFDCNTKVFIFDPRSGGTPIIRPDLSSRITSNLLIEGMYPNPTQDNVNFIFVSTHLQAVEYIIHNPAGKTMKVYKDLSIQKGRSIRACDLTDLNPGMYFITIKSSEQCIGTFKIIKK